MSQGPEDKFVEEIRRKHGRRHVHGHLLDIIDRLAPNPVSGEEWASAMVSANKFHAKWV